MNNLMNTTYWTLWAKLGKLDLREEAGAEAIEWIAMVAVILILLLALQPIFQQGGQSIGSQSVDSVLKWIKKFV